MSLKKQTVSFAGKKMFATYEPRGERLFFLINKTVCIPLDANINFN